jgi:archaellin
MTTSDIFMAAMVFVAVCVAALVIKTALFTTDKGNG